MSRERLRPTTGWVPGQDVVDTLDMQILPDTAPGTYHLMVGLYTRIGQTRLTASTADGHDLGNYWEMTPVDVAP